MIVDWPSVYKNQIWNMVDRKLAEFNYKLICNILCTKSQISRWNPNMNSNCALCGERQTVRHLLFECGRVEKIWNLIGTILKMKIRYKHIIIGNKVDNDYIRYSYI